MATVDIHRNHFVGLRPALFGVFRTVDLGQQYDTVPRIGGNFSFPFDTFTLRRITFGVARYSTLPSRPTPVFPIPRGILLCVGPHPALFLVLLLGRCAVLLPAFVLSSN
jgi:hypothetical protein